MDDSHVYNSSKNRKWTDKETIRLCNLANQYDKDWKKISEFFPGRIPKLCQMRWMISKPGINKTSMTVKEMNKLYTLVKIHGTKWKYLTSYFNNRHQHQLSNAWKSKYLREKRCEAEIYNQCEMLTVVTDTESISYLLEENEMLIVEEDTPSIFNCSEENKKSKVEDETDFISYQPVDESQPTHDDTLFKSDNVQSQQLYSLDEQSGQLYLFDDPFMY